MVVNGKLATSATVALRSAPGQRLRADAAAAWDRLAYACKRKYGWLPRITDSYRPYSVQEAIFRKRYRRGKGYDTRYWKGEPWHRVTGAAAAIPGQSNHGWGLAVDCTDLAESGFYGTRYKQLVSLATAYGFTNSEGRKVDEPWHLVYNPGLDKHKGERPVGAWDMKKVDLRNAHKKPVVSQEVRKLNALLMAHGYGPTGLKFKNGSPSNRASITTRKALGAFQVKTRTGTGGKPDYIAGDNTWSALIED